MTEVILKRRAGRAGEVGLFPVDSEGQELINKLRNDRDIGADIVQRRNPRHHRLFFALCQFVKEHSVTFEDAAIDEIKDAVKLACGLVTRYVDSDTAKTYFVLKSISFAAMDQTEFNVFFQTACDVIAKRWLPEGTLAEDVRRELILMVDGPYAIDDGRPRREQI